MRTKALFLTAALGVAAILSATAQVYSVNVVGYVNVNLTPGYNLICNPLNNTAGNELSKILPLADTDIGTIVYRYQNNVFDSSTFLGTAAGWVPNLAIAPGEGILVNIAAAKTVTFVGDVLQGANSNMQVPGGLSMLGSKVPQSAKLEDLGFPAAIGDIVYFYRAGAYASSTFIGTWVPDAIPAVGEGFWSSKAAGGAWNRNFTVQ